jgi:hypothetical protein
MPGDSLMDLFLYVDKRRLSIVSYLWRIRKMPVDLKVKNDPVSAFNHMADIVLEEAVERRKIVIDGTMMGCPKSVPKFGPDEMDGIREATENAKTVFAGKIFLPGEGVDRSVWEKEFVETLTKALEENKYYGDPEDSEPYAYNGALEEIMSRIPGFVKDLAI